MSYFNESIDLALQDEPKVLNESLRSVKVTYDNGFVMTTDMSANLTDDEINAYYKIGKQFNIGAGEKDLMVKVKKVEILK